jgi:hypothetical protein
MTIVGIPTAVVSIYCILNPKACFGSCPTFYGWDGEDTTLMAEGFSSSILRSFEKQDIDMLYWTKVNQIEEMGPIASDIHLIKLPETVKSPLRVRLKMTKGLWRIDYLALAKLEESIEPVRIQPSIICYS